MQKKVMTLNIFRTVGSKPMTIKWISNVMSENNRYNNIILKLLNFKVFVKWRTIDRIDGNKTADIRTNDFLVFLINVKNIEDKHVTIEKTIIDLK